MKHFTGQVHDLPQDPVNPVTHPDSVFKGFNVDIAGFFIESLNHDGINKPDHRGFVDGCLFFFRFFRLLLDAQFLHGFFHFGNAEVLFNERIDFLLTGYQGLDVKAGNQP